MGDEYRLSPAYQAGIRDFLEDGPYRPQDWRDYGWAYTDGWTEAAERAERERQASE